MHVKDTKKEMQDRMRPGSARRGKNKVNLFEVLGKDEDDPLGRTIGGSPKKDTDKDSTPQSRGSSRRDAHANMDGSRQVSPDRVPKDHQRPGTSGEVGGQKTTRGRGPRRGR